MVNLFVKNVKEGPLRNLTEYIRNKYNMSLIWLYGFELASSIVAATQVVFKYTRFWKVCQIAHTATLMINLPLDSGLCHKPHQWVTPSTEEKEFWFCV